MTAVFDHSKEKYNPRKVIPVNVKTTGDYLLMKRIKANLSPEATVLVCQLKVFIFEELVHEDVSLAFWKH